MMATRTAYIVQDVLRLLGDAAARGVTRKGVVRVLGQVQEDVCREGLAIRFEGEMTLEADKDPYDVGGTIWKVEKFMPPSTWQYPFTIITNVVEWARLKNEVITIGQPLYGFIVDRWLHFYPIPATTGEVVGIIGRATPENVLTEATDPEVGPEWDEALKFGTVARLDPKLTDGEGVSYDTKYANEMKKLRSLTMNESIEGTPRQTHWSRTLSY